MLATDKNMSELCKALSKILHSAYQIISQGACDIINIRHDIAVLQSEHNRRRMLSERRLIGQQLFTTWLPRGIGHYSTEIQQHYEHGENVEYGDDEKEKCKVS